MDSVCVCTDVCMCEWMWSFLEKCNQELQLRTVKIQHQKLKSLTGLLFSFSSSFLFCSWEIRNSISFSLIDQSTQNAFMFHTQIEFPYIHIYIHIVDIVFWLVSNFPKVYTVHCTYTHVSKTMWMKCYA